MNIINNYLNDNNIIDTLKECITQRQFNILRLLCIAYKDIHKDDPRFMKIFNLSKNNNQNVLINIDIEAVMEGQIKILLICNWCSSEELCTLWNKMSQGNRVWDNIEIVSEEPADYYCIINKPMIEFEDLNLERTILFRMEPCMEKHPEIWGDKWSNPKKEEFLFHGGHDLYLNNVEWHLSKTYGELCKEEVMKDISVCNVLSTVLSDKYRDLGQQRRIDFIKFLEGKDLQVDIFGGDRFLWKNYKGSLPSHQKDNALFPYKYTFNCENHSIKNYCTEKLYDGILAECLVFYSGCFNIRDTIDNRAFVYLELSNFEKDYQTIKRAIAEDWWSQRLPYIKEAKKLILNELQFFPRLKKIIEEKKL